jgi:D-3-phosphoglycerate dehydrogenase
MANSAARVLITTVPFAQHSSEALDRLRAARVVYTINPLNRRLKEHELAGLAADYDVLIAGTEPITARVMDAAPRLRLISRVGIGLDSVDLHAARQRGIRVSYTPDAPAPAVAELTIGLMLALLRHVPAADRSVRAGQWHRLMGRRLDGLTVGVVGVGRVGRRVIGMLRAAFPATRIVAHDIAPDESFGRLHGVRWVDPGVVFAEADIVTLHVPLTPATIGLVGARALGLMKPTAFLINTARGPIVNEPDLACALHEGRLLGAALDVFCQEPYTGPLAVLDNVILTCHMGSMSEDCRARMELEATDEAIRFARGEPLERSVPESEYMIMEPSGQPDVR